MKTSASTQGRLSFLTAMLVAVIGGYRSAHGIQEYTIHGVDSPSGSQIAWNIGSAPEFTRSGQVLGLRVTGSDQDSFMWTAATGTQLFARSSQGGTISIDSVNAGGTGVGSYRSPSYAGYYWSTPGIEPIVANSQAGYANLGQFPLQSSVFTVRSTQLFDITDAGIAYGTYFYSGQMLNLTKAFRWSEQQGFEEVAMASATKVNATGSVLDGFGYGLMLHDGTYRTISFGTTSRKLADVNDDNMVVGYAKTSSTSNFLPYAWDPVGGVRVLSFQNDSLGDYPFAVNNRGDIVGYALLPVPAQGGYAEQAVLWTHDGGYVRLNDLAFPGWDLTRATDIDEAGRIIGLGRLDGQQSMFMLTPVPEPAAWAFVTVSSFAMVLARLVASARRTLLRPRSDGPRS